MIESFHDKNKGSVSANFMGSLNQITAVMNVNIFIYESTLWNGF